MLLFLICAMSCTIWGAASASEGGEGTGFFTEAPTAAADSGSSDIATSRSRPFVPNLGLIGDGEQTPIAEILTLNLFEDETFTAVLERVERHTSGSFTWIGRLVGTGYGTATFVIKDGIVVGTVSTSDATYQIRYAGDGVHVIDHMDSRFFPEEVPPIAVPLSEDALDMAPGAPAR